MPPLAVHTDAGVWSRPLQIAEDESLAAAHRRTVLHPAAQRQVQLTVPAHVDVQVRTIVKTVVFEGLVVVGRESLEQRVLVQESGRDEITHLLRTTVDVDVHLLLPGRVVHHVVYPVRIGERRRHVALAEMLHHVLAEPDARIGIRGIVGNGCAPRPLAHRQRVCDRRVVPHLAVRIGVCKVHKLRDRLYGRAGRHRHRSLAWRTALRRHQDYTVGTPHTEHRRRRSILQDRDVLNLVRVQLAEAALHAVHQYQRLRTVQRTRTAHPDHWIVSARHTRRLHHRHARQLTLQRVAHVRHRRLQQLVAVHRRHSTRNGHLLLLSVGDHHHLLQRLRVRLHHDVHAPGPRPMCLREIAHIGELKRCPLADVLDAEVTVKVGNRTSALALHHNGHADERFARLILHRAFHRQILGKHLCWHQTQQCQDAQ